VDVVDVNVTIRSKAIEEHVFKDRKPRKTKIVVEEEKKNNLRNQWWKQFNKFKKHRPKQKGHPCPWRDGTQPS
jgi:hypothetical protein